MLHATQLGKGRLYTRYLGHRDGSERKVHEEDEVTSTVLGPLAFLPAADVYRFWAALLATDDKHHLLPDTMPEAVEVNFWPRFDGGADRTYVEPDVVVDFRWPDGTARRLIVEVKWRAGCGTQQLQQQWEACRLSGSDAQTAHVFLALSIEEGFSAIAEKDVWGGRLALVSWLSVRRVLQHTMFPHGSGARVWAELADAFLEKVQVLGFSGFARLLAAAPVNRDVPLSWQGFQAMWPQCPQNLYQYLAADAVFYLEKRK